jgi:hypothetical protein
VIGDRFGPADRLPESGPAGLHGARRKRCADPDANDESGPFQE